MLTLPERQAIAGQLEVLRSALAERPEVLISDLPKDLQHQIRSQIALQPITSGGLERVKNIMSRLNWAIFYLKDPDFPPKPEQPPQPATPPPAQPVEEPKPLIAPNPGGSLSFGPFDPKGPK